MTPDLIAPIHGYRWWLVRRAGPEAQLYSAAVSVGWPFRAPLRSRCPNTKHERQIGGELVRIMAAGKDIWGAPGPPCAAPHPSPIHACGLHAFRSLDTAIRENVGLAGYSVLGRVALWGTVRVHVGERPLRAWDGYRAEYAYPVDLVLTYNGRRQEGFDGDRVADQLAEAYGVPVTFVDYSRLAAPFDADLAMLRGRLVP